MLKLKMMSADGVAAGRRGRLHITVRRQCVKLPLPPA